MDGNIGRHDQTKAGISSKATISLVALIVFIDMLGISLIVPVMPDLLEEITGRNVAQAAEIGGYLLFAYATMQFLFAPIIGGLSDRFGRRPVLLITLFALGVDYAIMAWAPSLFWLFLGRIIAGIMGASWAAANSCIADLASPEERGKFFGIMGGAGAAGFVVGPALGGLLGDIHIRLPFVCASAFAIGGAVLGFWLLRETLPEEKRRAFTLARANPLGTIIQMSRTPIVLGFLIVAFFLQMSAHSYQTIWSYHTKLVFDWSLTEIGLSVACFGVAIGIVQGGLTGKVIAAIGPQKTALAGLALSLPAHFIFAFAPFGWVMFVGIIVGAIGGLTFPAMQQMMSERVSEDAQGELQGAVASTISITSIIGPVIMTGLFSRFADSHGLYFPGAPYLLSAILLTVAIIIAYWNIARMRG